MANNVRSDELPALIAKAVQTALTKLPLSETDLQALLQRPITIGLMSRNESTSPDSMASADGASISPQPETRAVASPLLIGFIAKSADELKIELAKE